MEAMLGDILTTQQKKETPVIPFICSMCGESVKTGAGWKKHFQNSCTGKDRVIKRLNKIGGLS